MDQNLILFLLLFSHPQALLHSSSTRCHPLPSLPPSAYHPVSDIPGIGETRPQGLHNSSLLLSWHHRPPLPADCRGAAFATATQPRFRPPPPATTLSLLSFFYFYQTKVHWNPKIIIGVAGGLRRRRMVQKDFLLKWNFFKSLNWKKSTPLISLYH